VGRVVVSRDNSASAVNLLHLYDGSLYRKKLTRPRGVQLADARGSTEGGVARTIPRSLTDEPSAVRVVSNEKNSEQFGVFRRYFRRGTVFLKDKSTVFL